MADLKRARQAFRDFSGHEPRKVTRAKLDDRDVAGWKMGPVVGIAYEAKRDGETARYFHEFKKSARPNLVAKHDGRQLYIEGGKYKVTDRGIEDMPALFVVNPSPRKGKTKGKPMARRRRSAARRRAPVVIVRSNPAPRRRKRRSAARRATYRANPIRRASRRRSYRRNPIRRARRAAGGALNFGKWVLPAAGIGLGAVGAEVIMGYLPIPANFKVGPARQLVKGAVAVAAGMLIGKVLKQKRIGNAIALGGVAIAVHDFAREMLSARLPGVQLGGMGMYMAPTGGSLGYYNPAATLPGNLGMYVDTAPGGFSGVSSDGYSPNFTA